MNPYDPHNYDDYYAEEYGGYGSINDRRGPRGRDRDGGRFNSRGGPPPRGPMGYVLAIYHYVNVSKLPRVLNWAVRS